ncbi:SDR family NAD(P)-dependent oxidoreductase [Microbacterium sp. ASV81]|uniref:SDR family NAD(P)-dependent oxidoreductase n=1 Tax=Microbacterium capsulatum TaxID=3041921 RepID=A0ABU0XHD8_9MICO|nr:SDR family NAD(P)-dependent oxidoreductase [Microbacterium sp. ASV81]MDQ4214491.1 SDR family NAD(P)-dependent oxidoreductase [Microbacterium sp. ASV81]
MRIADSHVVVTGGASGLGLATAERLHRAGATVTILDLPQSAGTEVAAQLGERVRFAGVDITSEEQVSTAFAEAAAARPVRALVHCAGRGRPMRILDREGNAAPLGDFAGIVDLNVVGTFNVLRFAAQHMAKNEPLDGDRGVVVLTASVAAFEGQIGQINYAASKAAIVGMTLPAARDLAKVGIRVCTIAPGTFATPLLLNAGRPDIVESLAASIPHPSRLGDPDEFAALAEHIISNGMLNGETIRIDGAIRMAPR